METILKTYKLLIKIHRKTGLKYLCVTRRDDYKQYNGSGLYWKKHLKKYGKNVKTILVNSYDNKQDLYKAGLYYSSKYDVVESDRWANLIPETGYNYDGITRNGWFGWYNSLTEEEKIKRNKNISKRVKERISSMNSEEYSKSQRDRRLNISHNSAERRKRKIQEIYATGKHDSLFERYSKERQGGNNPAAIGVIIEGVKYFTIKEACESLSLTRSVINRRLKSDAWPKWKREK